MTSLEREQFASQQDESYLWRSTALGGLELGGSLENIFNRSLRRMYRWRGLLK